MLAMAIYLNSIHSHITTTAAQMEIRIIIHIIILIIHNIIISRLSCLHRFINNRWPLPQIHMPPININNSFKNSTLFNTITITHNRRPTQTRPLWVDLRTHRRPRHLRFTRAFSINMANKAADRHIRATPRLHKSMPRRRTKLLATELSASSGP